MPAFSLDMVRIGPAKSIQRHPDPLGAALWDLEQYSAARILVYEVKKRLPPTRVSNFPTFLCPDFSGRDRGISLGNGTGNGTKSGQNITPYFLHLN